MNGTVGRHDTARGTPVSLGLSPDFLKIRSTLEDMRVRLTDVVPPDVLIKLEIIAAEILNNVVEHAFADHEGTDGRITLEVRPDASRLTLKVTDNGKAMPNGAVPVGAMPDFDPEDQAALPEGGFGWGLIHEMSDGLIYTRDGSTNRLDLWIDMETANN